MVLLTGLVFLLFLDLLRLYGVTEGVRVFRGTTTERVTFTCHCANPNEQCDDVTGVCAQSGCDDPTWAGPGCQTGNIAYGKHAATHYNGNTFPHSAVANIPTGNVYSIGKQRDVHWWQVDFGSAYVVKYMCLLSTDATHLIDDVIAVHLTVYLTLSDVSSHSLALGAQCELVRGEGVCSAGVTNTCPTRVGRYVSITSKQREDETITSLFIHNPVVHINGYEYHTCRGTRDGEYHYGPGCLLDCHCESQCDDVTGACPGECMPGYQGYQCESCADGRWGPGCAHACRCSVACDTESGYCSGTCDSGYGGYNCQQCDDSHWGVGCVMECHCAVPCRNQDGWCAGLCDAGYQGYNCQTPCDVEAGRWGPGCINQCQGCNGQCDGVTGRCSERCGPHYTGDPCQSCDYDEWGENCNNTCHCANNVPCDLVTGICDAEHGCQIGYQGNSCDEECDSDHYGPDCRYECDARMTLTGPTGGAGSRGCNHVYGYHHDCPPGHHGDHCQHSCDQGYSGLHCANRCNCLDKREQCDKISGHCRSGCAVGYGGHSGACNVKLYDMSNTSLAVITQATNGRSLVLTHQLVRHVTQYQVQFSNPHNTGDIWMSLQTVHVPRGDAYRHYNVTAPQVHAVTVTMPAVRHPYQLRVVPVQDDGIITGTPTPSLSVYTQCRMGWQGHDCEHVCNCTTLNIDTCINVTHIVDLQCDTYYAAYYTMMSVVCVAVACVVVCVCGIVYVVSYYNRE